MKHMTCTGKQRNALGEVIGYEVQSLTTGEKTCYGTDFLRNAILTHEISLDNLHLDPFTSQFLPVGEAPVVPEASAPEQPAAAKKPARKSRRASRGRRKKSRRK